MQLLRSQSIASLEPSGHLAPPVERGPAARRLVHFKRANFFSAPASRVGWKSLARRLAGDIRQAVRACGERADSAAANKLLLLFRLRLSVCLSVCLSVRLSVCASPLQVKRT